MKGSNATGGNITDSFVDDLYNVSQTTHSDSTVLQAKQCILDYLGVTLAGARVFSERGNELLDSFHTNNGETTVIGFCRKSSMEQAALINGMSSHIVELDDGERFGSIHPGAPILSALFPIVEREKRSGSDLLTGVITGYEAAIRLARMIQPAHRSKGFHATGTCGCIGAAMGVAAALGFSRDQMKHSLSSAATSAAGMLQVIADASELKPYNAGRAALDGLSAALVARANIRGPDDILGDKMGFLSMMGDSSDFSCVELSTPNAPAIEQIYRKQYAACRHCHSAIEAIVNMRRKFGFQASDVQSITVITYQFAADHLHCHTLARGVASAKMSIPYSVAAALLSGDAEPLDSSSEVQDAETVALAQKVQVHHDDELTKRMPKELPAIVEVTLCNGSVYKEQVDLPKGEPERPFSTVELEEKFVRLATYGGQVSQEEVATIIRSVWNIENNMDKLLNCLYFSS